MRRGEAIDIFINNLEYEFMNHNTNAKNYQLFPKKLENKFHVFPKKMSVTGKSKSRISDKKIQQIVFYL